jgi:hypothetical protein
VLARSLVYTTAELSVGVLQSGLAGLVPLNLAARFLVLFEFFDASFNDLGEAYGAAFLLRGLV